MSAPLSPREKQMTWGGLALLLSAVVCVEVQSNALDRKDATLAICYANFDETYRHAVKIADLAKACLVREQLAVYVASGKDPICLRAAAYPRSPLAAVGTSGIAEVPLSEIPVLEYEGTSE